MLFHGIPYIIIGYAWYMNGKKIKQQWLELYMFRITDRYHSESLACPGIAITAVDIERIAIDTSKAIESFWTYIEN